MLTSKVGFLFSLFWLIYLPVQVYLCVRACAYIRHRVQNPARRKLAWLFTVLFFLIMLTPLAWRALFGVFSHQPYSAVLRALFTASTIWGVGSAGCAFVLIGYNFFRRIILFALSFSRRAQTVPDLQRRAFLQRSVQGVAAAPFLVSGYGVLLERRRFEVDYFHIPVSGLSSNLSQLSIVQLTDIHVGPFMPAEELAGYVEAVNRLKPDIVALTGDFVTSSAAEAEPCAETLGRLRARYGVFACMGNHDVYAAVDDTLTELFAQRNIRTLRNDGLSIPIGHSKIGILGIEDLRWGKPDFSRVVRISQEDPTEVRILLSHRPEIFPRAASKAFDLVLAGHYHGGQVKLGPEPESLSIASLLTPYVEGLFHLSRPANNSAGDPKAATLFVSRGIGITGLPIRINCPPQIAHLTLRKA